MTTSAPAGDRRDLQDGGAAGGWRGLGGLRGLGGCSARLLGLGHPRRASRPRPASRPRRASRLRRSGHPRRVSRPRRASPSRPARPRRDRFLRAGPLRLLGLRRLASGLPLGLGRLGLLSGFASVLATASSGFAVLPGTLAGARRLGRAGAAPPVPVAGAVSVPGAVPVAVVGGEELPVRPRWAERPRPRRPPPRLAWRAPSCVEARGGAAAADQHHGERPVQPVAALALVARVAPEAAALRRRRAIGRDPHRHPGRRFAPAPATGGSLVCAAGALPESTSDASGASRTAAAFAAAGTGAAAASPPSCACALPSTFCPNSAVVSIMGIGHLTARRIDGPPLGQIAVTPVETGMPVSGTTDAGPGDRFVRGELLRRRCRTPWSGRRRCSASIRTG